MAELNTATRNKIDKYVQRNCKRDTGVGFGSLSAADLRAALDAIDVWVESNSAAFNTAIPQPARGALTAKQKAYIFKLVMEERYGVS